MIAEIAAWLGAERYSQHSICLTNDPLMIFLYSFGDLITFSAYFTLGLILLMRPYTPAMVRGSMRILFGAFIFLCGLSHLGSVMTLFWGIYRLDVLITVAMAAVSGVTAVVAIRDALADPA